MTGSQWRQLRKTFAGLSQFDLLILTSKNAAAAAGRALAAQGQQNAAPANHSQPQQGGVPAPASGASVPVLVIGSSTAAAARTAGFERVLTAAKSSRGGILETLQDWPTGWGAEPRRILLPQSSEAGSALAAKLCSSGFEVQQLTAYLNQPRWDAARDLQQAVTAGRVSVFAATSSSNLINLAAAEHGNRQDEPALRQAAAGLSAHGLTVTCIGPSTAKTARALGFARVVQAPQTSLRSLLEESIRVVERGLQ